MFMDACLTKASDLGCRSIAFPVLGTGILKYPFELVASEMFTSILKFQQTCESTLENIFIVVYPTDKETFEVSSQAWLRKWNKSKQ